MKNLIILSCAFLFSLGLQAQQMPLDDITSRGIVDNKIPLVYPSLNERDVFWENRIWRVIDTREKMNMPFINPERPLFDIIVDAAKCGKIALYAAENDDFSIELNDEELHGILVTTDTVGVYDIDDSYNLRVVENELYYEDIRRYRVKEVWFFDSQASVMRVRILGIAPMQEVYDDNGNFKYEKPLFWVHYPSTREALAKELIFTDGNQAARTTWEDLFERRQFASYVYKESDVLDRRLKDMYSGVDLLLEAEKIEGEIFNFEMDLWSK